MTALDAGSALDFDGFAPLHAVREPHTHGARTATAVAPRMQPALERRLVWERRYARRLRVTDSLVVLGVSALAEYASVVLDPSLRVDPAVILRAPVLAAAIWLTLLALFQTRSATVAGSGAAEYKRVAHASGLALGILAIVFITFEWPGVRLQLMIALPLGLLALLVGRWSWRRWLHTQREFGHYVSRAIVAGSRDDLDYVIRKVDDTKARGFVVIGAVTDDGSDDDHLVVDGRTYPVVGGMGALADRARVLQADTVIVASKPSGDPDYVKHLSWELEGTAAELVLSSRLTDVAGPRISLKPVDGLPLIHVTIPKFEGGQHLLKRAMDIVVSSLAMIPIGLVMPLIALAIVIDDRGPVFFRQTRIGRDGEEFSILKFRTMRTTAEAELEALKAQNEGQGLLFKMKRDPRITRVGVILRKYSLDELPQFWNVLRGDMSVVGPRPPLPSEVVGYDGTVLRRLYIKPGITGLWQVSGRSDLSWDESVRLDLRYVENWSIMNDLMIMWRTAQVMIAPKGAY